MIDIQNILDFFKSLIPYIPTLFVAYAVIKLLSSGLSLVAKAISTLALIALCYWAVMYLMAMF